MRRLAAKLLGTGRVPPIPSGRCAACRHFMSDPRRIEAALPGLAVLASANASVFGDDGLCDATGRFTNARAGCGVFAGLRDAMPA